MKKLGAVPVGLPRPEVYIALQKGIVKAAVGPYEALKGFREAEVTKYLTIVPGYYNKVFFVTMNYDKWNALPKDIQAAFDRVNDGWAGLKSLGFRLKNTRDGWSASCLSGMNLLSIWKQRACRGKRQSKS